MGVNHMSDISTLDLEYRSTVGVIEEHLGFQESASLETFVRTPAGNFSRTLITIKYDSLSVGAEEMTVLIDGNSMATTTIPSNEQRRVIFEVISIDPDVNQAFRAIRNLGDESKNVNIVSTGAYNIDIVKTSGTGHLSYVVNVVDI